MLYLYSMRHVLISTLLLCFGGLTVSEPMPARASPILDGMLSTKNLFQNSPPKIIELQFTEEAAAAAVAGTSIRYQTHEITDISYLANSYCYIVEYQSAFDEITKSSPQATRIPFKDAQDGVIFCQRPDPPPWLLSSDNPPSIRAAVAGFDKYRFTHCRAYIPKGRSSIPFFDCTPSRADPTRRSQPILNGETTTMSVLGVLPYIQFDLAKDQKSLSPVLYLLTSPEGQTKNKLRCYLTPWRREYLQLSQHGYNGYRILLPPSEEAAVVTCIRTQTALKLPIGLKYPESIYGKDDTGLTHGTSCLIKQEYEVGPLQARPLQWKCSSVAAHEDTKRS